MSDIEETPDEDDGDECEEPGAGPPPAADDPHAGDRLMLEACWAVISTRYDEPFDNAGVQVAYERMLIAVMERIARICRNDLPTDEP